MGGFVRYLVIWGAPCGPHSDSLCLATRAQACPMLRKEGLRIRSVSLLLFVLVACAGAGGADSSVTTPPAVTSTGAPVSTTVDSTTSTTSATVTTLAPDAAPPEIRGTWTTTIAATGAVVELTLRPTTWTMDIRQENFQQSGKISVEGDTIEFSLGEFCQGSGSYTWALEREMLTFAVQGVDECGRSRVLDGITYTFLAPLP